MPRGKRKWKQPPSPRTGTPVHIVETEITRHQPLPEGFTWKWKAFATQKGAENELARLRAAGIAGTFSQVRGGKYIVMRRQRPPKRVLSRKTWQERFSSKEELKEHRAFVKAVAKEGRDAYYQCAKCGRKIVKTPGGKLFLSRTGERFHWSCRPEGALRG